MQKTLIFAAMLLLGGIFAREIHAGGSGLNVLVVANQHSTNSVQLGNYYCQQRNVPPQNYLRINWAGTNTEWTLGDFTTNLLDPVLAALSARQLTNQIDYVVLSMDIPYRVNSGANGVNSTTSALFYGFKNDPNGNTFCEITSGSSNMYAGSEGIFRSTPPINANSNSFLVTMITANDLATAKMVVTQGSTSDGTFPTNIVWLVKTPDTDRNVRFTEFDNTVFNTQLRGSYSMARTNTGNFSGTLIFFPGLVLGYEGGSYDYTIYPVPTFPPGAMADNLTSFSGMIFEDTAGADTLLNFIEDGASGSYGTITEPCNFIEKFPDSQTYFFQSRGFSIGECYYQSVTNPYQGMVFGEPLAAPFAQTGAGAWNFASNAVLAGATNLTGAFTESDALHPLQQVDLFVDGNWVQTITNIPPQSGNVLSVSLNGFSTTYIVPANATIRSVTSNLVNTLNNATYKANTKVNAIRHGDRIELQSTAAYTKTGGQVLIVVSNTSPSLLTTFIHTTSVTPTNFLDSIAQGTIAYTMSGTLMANSTATLTVTKTNNAVVTVTITNNGNTTLTEFAQQLVTAMSNTASLQGSDGLYGTDVQTGTAGAALFNFFAQSGGYPAAQIKANLSASSPVVVSPLGANTLTQNVTDLQPRQHLYITAGTSNLVFTSPFVTTNYADGYHQLAAVAYEGSHVHTQTRTTQQIIIKNTGLSATLTPVITGSNSTLQPTLQFMVAANTNNISSIQLFSTGGLLASATNTNSATFTLTYSNLDVGTHPFYAVVTQSNGHQYRTQTQYVGLMTVNYSGATLFGVDYPFPLQAQGSSPLLSWPATAGRTYTVLSTTNLLMPFQSRAMVTPTNSVGQFAETNTTPAQQFYRVSVAP